MKGPVKTILLMKYPQNPHDYDLDDQGMSPTPSSPSLDDTENNWSYEQLLDPERCCTCTLKLAGEGTVI